MRYEDDPRAVADVGIRRVVSLSYSPECRCWHPSFGHGTRVSEVRQGSILVQYEVRFDSGAYRYVLPCELRDSEPKSADVITFPAHRIVRRIPIHAGPAPVSHTI